MTTYEQRMSVGNVGQPTARPQHGQRSASAGNNAVYLPNLHLGSFSRLDIADYEGVNHSRYPTVPSQAARPVSIVDPYSSMGQQQTIGQRRYDPSPQDTASRESQVLPANSLPPISASGPLFTADLTSPADPATPRQFTPDGNRRPYAFQTPYPIFVPPLQAQQIAMPEEICIECMMRDRDMADVDVTSYGVWDRDSDADFREMLRREDEEEKYNRANGRPLEKRASKGDRLTEHNLKVWLTMNPKEPAARWQTLELYLKTQAALLEAEANARAQAMHESRMLENKMRDTYSQLRRSAYDTGVNALADDTTGGVRIKAPRPTSGYWANGSAREDQHRREMTLLENGMILERVDIRKEEREERERRRREERKWRKSSNGGGEVSPGSPPSPGMEYTTSSSGLYDSYAATSQAALSAFSATSSPRPLSTNITAPISRSPLPSSGSDGGNRGSRFLAFRHWTGPWGSSPSIAPSGGSMIDMHLGLAQDRGMEVRSTAGTHTIHNVPRRPRTADAEMQMNGLSRSMTPQPKKKKKPSGFGKFWRKVTGSRDESKSHVHKDFPRTDDDRPLTPPPPMSRLVHGSNPGPHSRHLSSPSLPMSPQPNHPRTMSVGQTSISPATAQSSLLPSPTSNRFPWRDSASDGRNSGVKDDVEVVTSPAGLDDNVESMKNVQSEVDQSKRQQTLQVPFQTQPFSPPSRPPSSVSKSLPPLPPGESNFQRVNGNSDSPPLPPGAAVPRKLEGPNPAFRTDGARRQSFSGITASRPQSNILPGQLPPNGSVPQYPQRIMNQQYSADHRYSEFGMSRRSLGRLDLSIGSDDATSPASATKRRSKFGFSSLFGKKDRTPDRISRVLPTSPSTGTSYHRTSFIPPQQYQQSLYVESAGDPYEFSASPTAMTEALPAPTPTIRSSERPVSSASHSAPWPPTRRIDDLVDRDPDFVAYRYPSGDVSLDLRK